MVVSPQRGTRIGEWVLSPCPGTSARRGFLTQLPNVKKNREKKTEVKATITRQLVSGRYRRSVVARKKCFGAAAVLLLQRTCDARETKTCGAFRLLTCEGKGASEIRSTFAIRSEEQTWVDSKRGCQCPSRAFALVARATRPRWRVSADLRMQTKSPLSLDEDPDGVAHRRKRAARLSVS